jgi:uncharacterized protein (TIGR03067 family)
MKTTLKTALGFTTLLCLQAGCTIHQPPVAELQHLQGTWEGVQASDKSDAKLGITFTGNSLHYQWLNSTSWYEASFTLPAGTNPQQLRATLTGYQPTNDIGTRDIGLVIGAIFKIEEGTLTLAASGNGGEEPPKTFDDATRYVLKKVQPQKKNTEIADRAR